MEPPPLPTNTRGWENFAIFAAFYFSTDVLQFLAARIACARKRDVRTWQRSCGNEKSVDDVDLKRRLRCGRLASIDCTMFVEHAGRNFAVEN